MPFAGLEVKGFPLADKKGAGAMHDPNGSPQHIAKFLSLMRCVHLRFAAGL